MEVGERVRLRGLQGFPHLNGKTGEVVSFDSEALRYVVRLDSDNSLKGYRLLSTLRFFQTNLLPRPFTNLALILKLPVNGPRNTRKSS